MALPLAASWPPSGFPRSSPGWKCLRKVLGGRLWWPLLSLEVNRGKQRLAEKQEGLLVAGRDVRECGFDGGLLPFELLVCYPRPGLPLAGKIRFHQSDSGNAQLNQLSSVDSRMNSDWCHNFPRFDGARELTNQIMETKTPAPGLHLDARASLVGVVLGNGRRSTALLEDSGPVRGRTGGCYRIR